METIYKIDNALCKHLSLMTPTINIVWENISYTPINGQPYLEAWLLPATTIPITLGPNCWEEFRGIFQITCVYPSGQGRGTAREKAAKIVDYFKRGTQCTYNGITVQVRQSYLAPGYFDDSKSWFRIPVSVVYWTFAN